MNTETQKGLARLVKDLTEIKAGKTWKVTGRAFTGRDGKQYTAGDSAPKTNVKVYGWTLASDLFAMPIAKAFTDAITAPNGDKVAAMLTATAEAVSKANHETRFAIFMDIVQSATAKKPTYATPEMVAVYVTNAKTATVKTAKVEMSLTDSLEALFG